MRISSCRSCHSTNFTSVLDLGEQPLANAFVRKDASLGDEPKYPLAVCFCRDCCLLQLNFTVPPADMFTDYVYVTSSTKPLVSHLQAMANALYEQVQPGPQQLVVDIGCNDGSLLAGYPADRVRRLGVEPSSVSEMALARGIDVCRAFFSESVAQDIVKTRGRAAIITATNVFAHIPDHDDFLRGIATLLEDGGLFVVEVPHVLDMLRNNLFDTIYHEHVHYFSLHALTRLLEPRGFRVLHVEKFAFGPSGPPVRVQICKTENPAVTTDAVSRMLEEEKHAGLCGIEAFEAFAERVSQIRTELLALVRGVKAKGKSVMGYGAPAKGNTILNACGFNTEWLGCIAEKNPLKCGLLTPGSHIPVVDEDSISPGTYDYALLLSWNLVDFFLERSDFIKRGGKFILPLPRPMIVP